MLPTIALVNFGPLLELFTVTIPKAGCTLSGPSGSGKSSIVDAYSLAHWGVNVDGSPVDTASVRGDGAHLTLTGEDLKLRIDVAPNGGWTRRLKAGDADPRRVPTAEAWRAELDALDPVARYGTRGETARRIMAPMGLIDLYLGESGPKRLRDAIVAALPPVDSTAVVAGLMTTAGYTRLDSDPADLKAALALQTATNRTEAEAGAIARTKSAAAKDAADRLASLTASAPTTEQVAEANAVVALVAEWRAYDVSAESWRRSDDALRAAVIRRGTWEQRKADLGTAPEVSADDAATARADLAREQAEHDRLIDAVVRAHGEVTAEEQRAEVARVLALREQEEAARAERAAARAEQERIEAEARHAAELARIQANAEADRKHAEEKAARDQAEAVRIAEEKTRAAATVVAAPVATPAPVAGALFASPSPAPTFPTDYREGFGDARDAAAAIVQWCRENGETDHRSMLHSIRGLTPENQNAKDEE